MSIALNEIIRRLSLHGFSLETQAAATLLSCYEKVQNVTSISEFLDPFIDELYKTLPSLSIVTAKDVSKFFN
ncbi:hypothetical protein KM1_028370 [Entamoeba histolytica HM-3:IMSS]|uniref:Uncharacterized protein n=3 Tax=Entamoeba TaxID=5758 RepID=K2HN11_ENTNP|nr:hypothetical protein ENU1_205990 [Entamoeba nuttalli P19]EKE37195.1 hypothetical protein ENU1_205990 [Entamoeba nuttalli P19]EMS13734.1 hypothetical protein KM1_028370 [Entamoeba histolytica HM-3:IMSS]|eukprot:XP_008860473.1 hypothetical protein ENU1_205990 [Entamoeba nuttalli P19]